MRDENTALCCVHVTSQETHGYDDREYVHAEHFKHPDTPLRHSLAILAVADGSRWHRIDRRHVNLDVCEIKEQTPEDEERSISMYREQALDREVNMLRGAVWRVRRLC